MIISLRSQRYHTKHAQFWFGMLFPLKSFNKSYQQHIPICCEILYMYFEGICTHIKYLFMNNAMSECALENDGKQMRVMVKITNVN